MSKRRVWSMYDPQMRGCYKYWSPQAQARWDAFWEDPEGVIYDLINFLAVETSHTIKI